MSSPRRSTWVALLALPVLVGAVLLMHGLDAGTHTTAAASAAEASGHDHDRAGCESCPGTHHVLAACVAVAATVATLRLARRTRCRFAVAGCSFAMQVCRAGSRLVEVARPPDPAWVRLSVMRC